MTALDVRDTLDLDIDLTRDVPCTLVEDCDRPAAWRCVVTHDATATVCGSLPCCDPHRRDTDHLIAAAIIWGERVTCRSHKVDVHATWRPL